ncbi:Uncharacterized protein Adt_36239 [Abeliophyllum distichum]|uniref:Uncharacterized protein n=1 Tax=Abeliophyllum distichum TaxID=126358 RepID=A0ABD1QGZ8_9LAMI
MTIVKEPKGIKIDLLFSDYLEHKETEFDWLAQPSRKSLEIDLFEDRTLVKEQNPLLLKTSSMRQKPTILLRERRSEESSSQDRQLRQISNTVNEMAKVLLPSS